MVRETGRTFQTAEVIRSTCLWAYNGECTRISLGKIIVPIFVGVTDVPGIRLISQPNEHRSPQVQARALGHRC
jgi:hypothetical protein